VTNRIGDKEREKKRGGREKERDIKSQNSRQNQGRAYNPELMRQPDFFVHNDLHCKHCEATFGCTAFQESRRTVL